MSSLLNETTGACISGPCKSEDLLRVAIESITWFHVLLIIGSMIVLMAIFHHLNKWRLNEHGKNK